MALLFLQHTGKGVQCYKEVRWVYGMSWSEGIIPRFRYFLIVKQEWNYFYRGTTVSPLKRDPKTHHHSTWSQNPWSGWQIGKRHGVLAPKVWPRGRLAPYWYRQQPRPPPEHRFIGLTPGGSLRQDAHASAPSCCRFALFSSCLALPISFSWLRHGIRLKKSSWLKLLQEIPKVWKKGVRSRMTRFIQLEKVSKTGK